MPEEDPLKLWQHIHGASVHFTIALAFVSIVFDLGATLFRRADWKTVGFWALIVATVLSVPALLTGLTGQLGWFHAEPWTSEKMPLHRLLAFIGSGILLLLVILRIGLKERLKGPAWVVYLALSLAAAALIGWTGYLGAYVARGY